MQWRRLFLPYRRLAPLLALLLTLWRSGAAQTPTPPSLGDLGLEDQHGVVHRIPADTRTVLFVSDMDASKIVHALLETRPPDWLAQQHAVFIADIHRMPGLVTRFIALPRMRERAYPILLITDDETGERFPREEDAVTVMAVDDLRPAGPVRFLRTAEAVEQAVLSRAATAAREPSITVSHPDSELRTVHGHDVARQGTV